MYESLLREVENSRKAPSAGGVNGTRLTPDGRIPPRPAAPGASPSSGVGAGAPAKQHPKNAWGRNILILIVMAAVAYGYVHFRHPFSATATAGPTPSHSSRATVARVPAITTAQAFPASVPGTGGETYRLVGAVKLTSCTEPDMVETYLAGLLTQSNGCAGAVTALYGDAAKNEFTVVVFTLDDPSDVLSIDTTLAMDPTDYEVGAISPPPSSGLADLSATSGLVQAFGGASHALVIGVAQWSDGHSSDYNALEALLQPLQEAVTDRVGTATG